MVDATKVSSIKIDTGYAGVKEYPIFSRFNKAGETINPAQSFSVVMDLASPQLLGPLQAKLIA